MRVATHPPSDPEAEAAVLNGLLMDPAEAWQQIGEDLSPDLFTGSHIPVAEAIIERCRAGKPVDHVIVAGDLRDRGHHNGVAQLPAKLHRKHAVMGNLRHYRVRLEEQRELRGDPARGLGFVSADQVKEEKVRWLWPGFLPLGKITILDGLPDVGKTTLALDMAAKVTRGLALPLGKERADAPLDVLILSAEDGLGDTLLPRLKAAGADLQRVLLHDAGAPGVPGMYLPDAVPQLREVLRTRPVGLVLIDPVVAYIDPAKYDVHKDQDVRVALRPVAALAEESGVAILVIRHLNKNEGASALLRGSGSIAFSGLARSVMLAAKDQELGHQVLASIKCNLAPSSMRRSMGYRIGDDGAGRPRVEWIGAVDRSADDLVAPSHPGPAPRQREQAAEFLREFLGGGARSRPEVIEAGRLAGFSAATIDRAMKVAGVVSENRGRPGRDGCAWWCLAAEGSTP